MLPCYQQRGDTCGYWCTRIAAEILLGRKFRGEELKRFKKYKSMCSREGVTLMLSVVRFNNFFPELGINFDALDNDRVNSKQIEEELDKENTVVLLNMQNMDFSKDRIVENTKENYGHNVCCYGYDDTYFYIQDSNKYNKNCKKTLLKELVNKGAKAFENVTIDNLRKLNKSVFHIAEAVSVYKGEPRKKVVTVRRSRRRRFKF